MLCYCTEGLTDFFGIVHNKYKHCPKNGRPFVFSSVENKTLESVKICQEFVMFAFES